MDFKKRKIRYKRESPLSKIKESIKLPSFKKNDESTNVFEAHSIQDSQKTKRRSGKTKYRLGLLLGIVITLALVFYGCTSVIKQIGIINIIGIFGEQLQTDSYGNTNILLVGTGGEGHDGPDLTDTLIVASIDQGNNIVPMVSIPRDFYVDVEDFGYGVRINHIYDYGKEMYDSEKGLEILRQKVEDITGIKIHYYVKINFQGFKDIVDSLGGVNIYVDEAINDPYYPLEGTIYYDPFYLGSGDQELDGETALKYARSRKTTSDFDRSKRQQKLLFAIKEKAMTKNVLLNPGKITSLYDAVSKNIETNLSMRHIIELAKISQDFGQENIINRVITDDTLGCGGYLYTPDKNLFGGAFVLVPVGNHFDFIHQYVDLSFHYPEAIKDPIKIQVLNGAKELGLAAETKAMLQRLCFDVIRFGNAQSQDITETKLYYKGEEPPESLYFINQLIPGEITNEIPDKYFEPQYQSEADVIIELGQDYVDYRPEDIFYLYYPVATPSSNTTNEESSAEESTTTDTAPAEE